MTARLRLRDQRERWRPRRPTVPEGIRRQFAGAAISVSVAWAVAGLFLSLIPSFVTMTLQGGLALAGAVVALMLGCATIVHAIQAFAYAVIAICLAGLAALFIEHRARG